MNWTLVGIFGTILAFGAYIWYTIKRQASIEDNAKETEEARKAEEARRVQLEQQAAKDEAKKREDEASNAQKINDSHDVDSARRLLGDSFKDSHLN